MRVELHPECIRFTSDCLGFEGFRALVCELPEEGEAGSGLHGYPYFRFACRPVQEKGRTLLTFEENRESALMSRISSIIPPNRPFHLSWRGAAGRIGCFDVHPRFFEEALRRAGIAAADLYRVPPPCFVIDRRVDWLCQLLMQETEQGCPGGHAYFESLANAVGNRRGFANRFAASLGRKPGSAAPRHPAGGRLDRGKLRLEAHPR